MKRAIGMAQGQYGDLVISTVPARSFKQHYPGATLTLGLNKRYAAILPLFANHEHYDDIHLYDAYDNWPSPLDQAYLGRARYDAVFDPMPKRANEAIWWRTEHQAQNACTVYGLPTPTDGLHCQLTQWFDLDIRRDTIAFAPFAGFYNPGNDKRLSESRAQEVVNLIRKLGYKVLQLGGPDEPRLDGAIPCHAGYFESIKQMLGCKMVVHTDSGCGWAASAYGFPQVGLYSNQYYSRDFVKHIQPISPNAIYLDEAKANQIELGAIEAAIKRLS
jgi:ADP-heptose:LPS heptosyltransferase